MLGLYLWAIVIVIIGICIMGWSSMALFPIWVFAGMMDNIENSTDKACLLCISGLVAFLLGWLGVQIEYESSYWAWGIVPILAFYFFMVYAIRNSTFAPTARHVSKKEEMKEEMKEDTNVEKKDDFEEQTIDS